MNAKKTKAVDQQEDPVAAAPDETTASTEPAEAAPPDHPPPEPAPAPVSEAATDPAPDTPEVIAAKADERQLAEKDPGPAPIDQASLLIAAVPEAQTLETVAGVIPSNEDLAKLDQTDAARAAALRKQRDWAEDSKKLFPRETEDEKDRKQMIVEMDAMDAVERKRQADERAKREKQEELETRDERIKELKAKMNDLRSQAQATVDEIERLEALS